MQFMLAIYEDEAAYADGLEGDAWKAIIEAHQKLGQAMAEAGIMRGGAGLKPNQTATTVRQMGREHTIHDGPYTETKEQLGGFYVIEVPGLDEAIAWAKRIPVTGDGAVEIRPVLDGDADAGSAAA